MAACREFFVSGRQVEGTDLSKKYLLRRGRVALKLSWRGPGGGWRGRGRRPFGRVALGLRERDWLGRWLGWWPLLVHGRSLGRAPESRRVRRVERRLPFRLWEGLASPASRRV